MGNHQFLRIKILAKIEEFDFNHSLATVIEVRKTQIRNSNFTHLLTVHTLNLAQLFRLECFQHIVAVVLHGVDKHTVLMLMMVMRCQCVTVAMISMTMPNYDWWLCVTAHFRLAQLYFIAHLFTKKKKTNRKFHISNMVDRFFLFVLFFPALDGRRSIFTLRSFDRTKHALTHTPQAFFCCRCRFINSLDIYFFFGPIFDCFVRISRQSGGPWE